MPRLRRLELADSLIGTQGLLALVTALRVGTLRRLQQLSIRSNGIKDVGAWALIGLLRGFHVRSLERIDLGDNPISEHVRAELTQLVPASLTYSNHYQWVGSAAACTDVAGGAYISNDAECQAAMTSMGLSLSGYLSASRGDWPIGCWALGGYTSSSPRFNMRTTEYNTDVCNGGDTCLCKIRER
jgi:hypothetical protein